LERTQRELAQATDQVMQLTQTCRHAEQAARRDRELEMQASMKADEVWRVESRDREELRRQVQAAEAARREVQALQARISTAEAEQQHWQEECTRHCANAQRQADLAERRFEELERERTFNEALRRTYRQASGRSYTASQPKESPPDALEEASVPRPSVGSSGSVKVDLMADQGRGAIVREETNGCSMHSNHDPTSDIIATSIPHRKHGPPVEGMSSLVLQDLVAVAEPTTQLKTVDLDRHRQQTKERIGQNVFRQTSLEHKEFDHDSSGDSPILELDLHALAEGTEAV
jgi:hypothetical protein